MKISKRDLHKGYNNYDTYEVKNKYNIPHRQVSNSRSLRATFLTMSALSVDYSRLNGNNAFFLRSVLILRTILCMML